MANGIADDLLSTILLATRAPVLIAPAMNDQMYSHPSTQENLRKLRERGVQVAGPASGPLACGREGLGRMVEPQEIVDRALGLLGLHGKLDGMKVLVTAGGTREPLDPVRFIGNRSSGKMGYALARVARAMGAEVDLVSGPSDLERPPRIETVEVETAQQMQEEVLARAKECRVIVMAAAVADYAPAEAKPYKIKKLDREDMRIDLKRTPDILEALGRDKAPGQVLVGFAAETEDLVENARQKLQAKNLDLIVANDVSGKESGFESDYNLAILLFSDGRRRDLPLMPKEDLAALVWDEIAGLLQGA
jgi:phosphopantothenoylcysteine decarboxylase/phosphopantothenate--cysteine ligase